MRLTSAFWRGLALSSVTVYWGCGAPDDDWRGVVSQPSEVGGPASPAPPSAAVDVPSTPIQPGTPATNPSNESLPTPSFQPPPVSSGAEEPTRSDAGSAAVTPAVTTPPAASCSSASTFAPGNTNGSLELDGDNRTFIVHVPPDLDPSLPVPLLVDMHGLTSSAGAQAALSGWRAKADEEGFIVVFPQGLGNSWNGGDLCCGSAQSDNVDDEGFIRALVAKLQAEGCIDPKRIYATGLSNGGAMAHLLACQAADLFAASAPVSMGNGTRPCAPARPISVVMTRGTQDGLVSFNGGLFPSAQADFEQWAELNGCSGEPEPVDELCQAFTNCAAGVEVKLCALEAGHVLYDNRQNFSVPDTVWATFERQTLP
jgi:polyhydroxybutyrate depolymerase